MKIASGDYVNGAAGDSGGVDVVAGGCTDGVGNGSDVTVSVKYV